MTDMTLTLDKQKLIQKLRDRRQELIDDDTSVADIQEALDKIGDVDLHAEALAAWHIEIAEGLREGTITISSAGRVIGGPKKPNINRESKSSQYHGYRSREDLERALGWAVENLESATKPLDAAIELLELSKDKEVSIDSGDYQALLTNAPRSRNRYW